jgi:hypothetical protein
MKPEKRNGACIAPRSCQWRNVPRTIDVGAADLRTLLSLSGAWLARYPGDLIAGGAGPDSWYYVVCERFVPLSELAGKIRTQVRKGMRTFTVRRVAADWLAANGYPCYRTAHSRYHNARPMSREAYERGISGSEGPYEHWGVFAGDTLAGYTSCVVGDEWVNHSVAKYDPAYLKDRSAYLLVRVPIEEYVGNRHLALTNGSRTISHDTNYNLTLQRLGFSLRACELRLVYRPALAFAVRIAYPFHGLIGRLPRVGPVDATRGILQMEQIVRLQDAHRRTLP